MDGWNRVQEVTMSSQIFCPNEGHLDEQSECISTSFRPDLGEYVSNFIISNGDKLPNIASQKVMGIALRPKIPGLVSK